MNKNLSMPIRVSRYANAASQENPNHHANTSDTQMDGFLFSSLGLHQPPPLIAKNPSTDHRIKNMEYPHKNQNDFNREIRRLIDDDLKEGDFVKDHIATKNISSSLPPNLKVVPVLPRHLPKLPQESGTSSHIKPLPKDHQSEAIITNVFGSGTKNMRSIAPHIHLHNSKPSYAPSTLYLLRAQKNKSLSPDFEKKGKAVTPKYGQSETSENITQELNNRVSNSNSLRLSLDMSHPMKNMHLFKNNPTPNPTSYGKELKGGNSPGRRETHMMYSSGEKKFGSQYAHNTRYYSSPLGKNTQSDQNSFTNPQITDTNFGPAFHKKPKHLGAYSRDHEIGLESKTPHLIYTENNMFGSPLNYNNYTTTNKTSTLINPLTQKLPQIKPHPNLSATRTLNHPQRNLLMKSDKLKWAEKDNEETKGGISAVVGSSTHKTKATVNSPMLKLPFFDSNQKKEIDTSFELNESKDNNIDIDKEFPQQDKDKSHPKEFVKKKKKKDKVPTADLGIQSLENPPIHQPLQSPHDIPISDPNGFIKLSQLTSDTPTSFQFFNKKNTDKMTTFSPSKKNGDKEYFQYKEKENTINDPIPNSNINSAQPESRESKKVGIVNMLNRSHYTQQTYCSEKAKQQMPNYHNNFLNFNFNINFNLNLNNNYQPIISGVQNPLKSMNADLHSVTPTEEGTIQAHPSSYEKIEGIIHSTTPSLANNHVRQMGDRRHHQNIVESKVERANSTDPKILQKEKEKEEDNLKAKKKALIQKDIEKRMQSSKSSSVINVKSQQAILPKSKEKNNNVENDKNSEEGLSSLSGGNTYHVPGVSRVGKAPKNSQTNKNEKKENNNEGYGGIYSSVFSQNKAKNKKKDSESPKIDSTNKKHLTPNKTPKRYGQKKEIMTHEINEPQENTAFSDYLRDCGFSNLVQCYTTKTRTGYIPMKPHKVNQDVAQIMKDFCSMKNAWFFGIFDGHGVNGHLVSDHVKNYLPSNLELCENVKSKFPKLFQRPQAPKNGKAGRKKSSAGSLSPKSDELIKLEDNLPNYSFPKSMKNKTSFFESYTTRQSIIKEAFEKTHMDLLNRSFECDFSGTTAVTVLLFGKKLICANVGDSRAIIAGVKGVNKKKALNESKASKKNVRDASEKKKEKSKRKGKKNNHENSKIKEVDKSLIDTEYLWVVRPLSIDHKPDLDKELKRILRHNGRVEAYKDLEGNPIGPSRVWLKNQNIPGLAMSRSIGDKVASQVGVLSEPEIFEKEVTEKDKIIVLGSDGIWEFMPNEEVIKVIEPYWIKNNAAEAADALVKEALAHWNKEDEVVDDITCIIVFLNGDKSIN